MDILLSKAGNATRAVSLASTASQKRTAGEAGLEQEAWDCRRLGQTAGNGHELDMLIKNLLRLGRTVSIPITTVPVPYFGLGLQQHEILSMKAFLQYMIKDGHTAKILGGHDISDGNSWRALQEFWSSYKCLDGDHSVFQDFDLRDPTKLCVPCFLYGDEGTGKRKHPVYILGWKPLLFCKASAWWRTFLYTVAPHELYSGFNKGIVAGNACLDAIADHFSEEAVSLYKEGRPAL